ncbi:MAG TPA: M23 family metallopeptidase [Candidatus Saccharimonadales bacterium]|nr:M23 family metallopeptidase [Candidatus Saccharimonadales bacterium]
MKTFLRKFKWRFVIIPMVVVADLFLMSLLPAVLAPHTAANNTVHAEQQKTANDTLETAAFDSPNAVTDSFTTLVAKTGQAASATGRVLVSAGRMSGSILHGVGTVSSKSSMFVVHGVRSGLVLTGNGLVGSVSFVARIPGIVLGFVSSTATSNALTHPTEHGKTPVIDPSAKVALIADTAPAEATVQPVTPTAAPVAAGDNTPSWPIHGAITTLFGVPHWPYQPTHTGIDISDGMPAGVTHVMPYRPGRVVEVIWSNAGLGNHVTIDHGDGIKSVYGHMATILVQTGQEVTKSTTLGLEGSTGASTGPHVHFELWVNGQVVDPLLYVPGRP